MPPYLVTGTLINITSLMSCGDTLMVTCLTCSGRTHAGRRGSTDVEDIFLAHISGMDTMARGLRNAAKLVEDGSLAELVRNRYKSFDSELGALIEAGKADFDALEKKAMELGEPTVASGKQELAEMIFQAAL